MLCCGYTACEKCVPSTCPACSSTIAQEDVARDEQARQVVEVARREWHRWKEVAVMEEEMERLREAVRCCRCREECSKAVSLACCSSSSCRRCALAAIRVDSRRCWGCGLARGQEDLLTPSQLANNLLVRAAVSFLGEDEERETLLDVPFKVFLLIFLKTKSFKRLRKKLKGDVELGVEPTWGSSSYKLDGSYKDQSSLPQPALPGHKRPVSHSEQIILQEKLKKNLEAEKSRRVKPLTTSEKYKLTEMLERNKKADSYEETRAKITKNTATEKITTAKVLTTSEKQELAEMLENNEKSSLSEELSEKNGKLVSFHKELTRKKAKAKPRVKGNQGRVKAGLGKSLSAPRLVPLSNFYLGHRWGQERPELPDSRS